MKSFSLCLALLALMASFNGVAAEKRALPKPPPQHPGNIFLVGEEIVVDVPKNDLQWSLLDDDGKRRGAFNGREGKLSFGKLPVGFYRLQSPVTNHWISLAVLEPLRAPTPATSPIAIDAAMAWFYGRDRMDAVANLCALAGVNWVRDRLNWAEMEPRRGEFRAPNKYDAAATAQSGAGLRVLQVIHYSPPWANPNGKRFPLDLRDAYAFFEAMAKRWRGRVQAFEPWNEADIPMFGGHTGAEMAALQKAAYLGLKSGNPDMIACLNVFAVHNTNQLADFHANEAWPYFDTYNLHHYEPFDRYPKLYADHRLVSAGRPLWVSECAVPVKWAGDEKLKEPTDADLRVQAERVAKTFACSLHEGSAATFYFLLPHYVEGQTQFGIVRPDLTPRPAFVALAAVGRLLADAKPLGRLRHTNSAVRAYFFRAKPDGRARDVLVAWVTGGESELRLPPRVEAVFDHLGRALEKTNSLHLSAAPVFALFPKGSARRLPLVSPPITPPKLAGEPSPIVFQALWPADRMDLKLSAFRVAQTNSMAIPVFAYNFGNKIARGKLRVATSEDWRATVPDALELSPGARKELALTLESVGRSAQTPSTLRLRGDFGAQGKPVMSLRLLRSP